MAEKIAIKVEINEMETKRINQTKYWFFEKNK